MANNFAYEILKLSDKFYGMHKNPLYKEILLKRNRPYNLVLFESKNDYIITIPFRTNLNHSNGFHFIIINQIIQAYTIVKQ